MTGDVIDCIKDRRSVRRYEDREVPLPTLQRLVECGRLAPSAGNRQPWHFYLVTSDRVRKGLSAAAYDQLFVAQAPAAIVVCAEPQTSAERYGSRGEALYCLQDTAAAVQNMLLAATGYGLGTCWVGAFDEEDVAKAIGVDHNQRRPVAIISVGYPAHEPAPRPRRSLDEVMTLID